LVNVMTTVLKKSYLVIRNSPVKNLFAIDHI